MLSHILFFEMLNVIMLSGIMLIVIMMSVVAPLFTPLEWITVFIQYSGVNFY